MSPAKHCFLNSSRPCDLTCKAAFEVDDPVDNIDCYFIWLSYHFGETLFELKRVLENVGGFPPGGPPGKKPKGGGPFGGPFGGPGGGPGGGGFGPGSGGFGPGSKGPKDNPSNN